MPEPIVSSLAGVGACLVSLAYATLLGLGALSFAHGGAARYRRFRTPEVLLAPGLGFAIVTIPAVWLNMLGLPVATFAWFLCIALFLVAVVRVAWTRESVAARCILPFAALIGITLVLVGRPLVEFGTDWMSYGNHDMTTYCLEAQRQIAHGFYDAPNAKAWLNGSDFSAYYLPYYAFGIAPRAGTDTLLAVLSVLTRGAPLQCYMPLIIALTAALVASATALVFSGSDGCRRALLTGAFLACSALVALGALSQLGPQVFGLTLLAAALAQSIRALRARSLGTALLASMASAALLLVYPEASPFLFGSVLLYVAIAVAREDLRFIDALKWCFIGAVVTAFAITIGWKTFVLTLMSQLLHGTHRVGETATVQFPYYLIPSGPPMLFGLVPIGTPPSAPGLDFAIIVGLALLAVLCALIAIYAWRNEPSALVCAIMTVLGAVLFVRHADFGLHKLAMFASPFLFGVLACAVNDVCKRSVRLRVAGIVAGVALVSANLVTQQIYVERSRAVQGEFRTAALAEIPDASPARIYGNLESLRSRLPTSSTIVSDTYDQTLAEVEASYLQGHPLYYLSYDYARPPAGAALISFPQPFRSVVSFGPTVPALRRTVVPLELSRRNAILTEEFVSPDAPTDGFTLDSRIAAALRSRTAILLESSTQQTVLNRWYSDENAAEQVEVVPLDEVQNHLVFVNSDLGQNLMFKSSDRSGLSNAQPDTGSGPDQTLAAAGRYLLLTVVGFHGPARMEFAVTEGSLGNGSLPPAKVYGAKTITLNLGGKGSARVITPVLQPRFVDGLPFFLIDAGTEGHLFPDGRRGLMNLYGRNIVVNWLKVAWLVHDISLVPADASKHLAPPSFVSRLPKALLDRNLLFSGIYDDGWVSDDADLQLRQRPRDHTLVVKGLVPPLGAAGFSTGMQIRLDGRQVGAQTVNVGYVSVTVNLPHWARPGLHTIGLRFDRLQRLPLGDGRSVAMLPSYLGFAP